MEKKQLEKRKLINLVTQGEAKNVKHIFEMPQVRDGLKEIMGERRGTEAYETMKKLVKAADQKDWMESYSTILGYMRNPNVSSAGVVSVDWQ